MYSVKVWEDPYGIGVKFTRAKNVELQEGLTVLVGCNGAGKTTLLSNIAQWCKTDKIPLYDYDNLRQGGTTALDGYLQSQDFSMLAGTAFASEGEAIVDNLGYKSKNFREFIFTGKNVDDAFVDKFIELLRDENDKEEISNKRVMLFDAIDSGLSIDQVREIKNLFRLMIEDAKANNIELYIVTSCNEFEMARGENCIDISSGRYKKIDTYSQFEKTVLKTREIKDRRVYKHEED